MQRLFIAIAFIVTAGCATAPSAEHESTTEEMTADEGSTDTSAESNAESNADDPGEVEATAASAEAGEVELSDPAKEFLTTFKAEIETRKEAQTAPRLTEATQPEQVSSRLEEMVAIDQYARKSINKIFMLGVSESEVDALMNEVGMTVMELDMAHTEELRSYVSEEGWPTISEFGEQTAKNAWLIAQHADQNPDFQKKVLVLMKPLVEKGEATGKNYAYLWDRVAVAEERPQRFGTQGICAGPKTWEPRKIEDAENVDARRAEIGLEPMAEYKARFVEMCQ